MFDTAVATLSTDIANATAVEPTITADNAIDRDTCRFCGPLHSKVDRRLTV